MVDKRNDTSRLTDADRREIADEMIPKEGERVTQEQKEEQSGDKRSTAGEHGDMAVDAAKPIGDKLDASKRNV